MFNINNARQFLRNGYQNYIQPIASVLPSVDRIKEIAVASFIAGVGIYVVASARGFFEEDSYPMKGIYFISAVAGGFIGPNLMLIGANTLIKAWDRWFQPMAPAIVAPPPPPVPVPTHSHQPTVLKNLTARENILK